MIVRVLDEGQYELDEAAMVRVEALDARLDEAIAAADDAFFDKALAALIAEVRSAGRRLDPGTIVPSDLAVPSEGSSLAEVRALLDEGAPEKA